MWWLLLMGGKLADGFRGVPYGPAGVLDTPPAEGCKSNPGPGSRWECPIKLGDASVSAYYMADQGLFYGMVLETVGYANASALHEVLVVAYGPCTKKHDFDTDLLADCTWNDGSVSAAWEYNPYSYKVQVLLFDRTLYETIRAVGTQRAAEAAKGL